jgi:hypothetical protein
MYCNKRVIYEVPLVSFGSKSCPDLYRERLLKYMGRATSSSDMDMQVFVCMGKFVGQDGISHAC